MDQDETWYGGRALTTLCEMGTQFSLPSPKRGTVPQFSAHVYCGQTAGCIRILLGTEVGLGPGDIVLDRDPTPPPEKRDTAPKFVAKRSPILATAEHLLLYCTRAIVICLTYLLDKTQEL